MSTTLIRTSSNVPRPLAGAPSAPLVPWRDPQSVSPAEIASHIQRLEAACLADPHSADLRTCLGMAYAVNYDVYRSMHALETAVQIDPEHFWGQLKLGELNFRLRALTRAETETLKAVYLARTPWELTVARKQLQEIRQLNFQSTRNITWDKPLTVPVLFLSALLMTIFVVMW